MKASTPPEIRLADYRPPPFLVDSVDLDFRLDPDRTEVRNRMSIRRNPAAGERTGDLRLDGAGLETTLVRLDGSPLAPERIEETATALTIIDPPDSFELVTEVRIRPTANTSLEGLYVSAGNFCTQCEAEGFRKITWFPDRPDVLARYRTTIRADAARCPVLLSNDNPVARGESPDGVHWATWEDPFPKPSYLFALVAGDLACVEDRFTTRSGRVVTLRFYVEPHNADKCDHAMRSLVKAMAWDEEIYGLEYDLDIFMIVAVDDFNMGAMENKGLNVFNSKYVLARPDTATDSDFAAIEGVIAHEYFHNWTGNRVTCRDWFQLSLKEGLTVFRDQEFSADATSRSVKRIQDVRILRTHQFAEDAGPTAHPVRPESYIEISNFYTVTIYNKGAELIRMLQTLLGGDAFLRGVALYLERHDGEAATIEDFLRAMEDAGGRDLVQFRRWYAQAGTPEVAVKHRYDADRRELVLDVEQRCPPTPGQPRKEPFLIPLRLGLVGREQRDVPFRVEGVGEPVTDAVLELSEPRHRFRLSDVAEPVVPSLGRGFSAPVNLRADRDDDDVAFLIANDSDPFNRWDASQGYAARVLVAAAADLAAGTEPAFPDALSEAFRRMLADPRADRALVAQALTLPSESYVADQMETVDPEAIHEARRRLAARIADAAAAELRDAYLANRTNEAYRFDAVAVGRRSLKNVALGLLMDGGADEARAWCRSQFETADNMTDAVAALACFANSDHPERTELLEQFHRRWRHDPLVLDKWLAIQSTSIRPDTLERVRELLGHDAFDIRNPNRVRSLIGAFCHGNQVRFHAADGSGYRFASDRILEIDAINPQVAARLVGAYGRWRRFDADRRAMMETELRRVLGARDLSRDSYEMVKKTLG